MAFNKILLLASKYSFFNPILSKNGKFVTNLQLGHSGSLLQENIKSEWMNSNVKNRDNDIHYFNYNNVEYDKSLLFNKYKLSKSNNRLPFGIAESYNKEICDNNLDDAISESKYFEFQTSTMLSSSLFLNTNDAMQFYLYWQRQRKLWWKKVSSFPGRFQLGEIDVHSDGTSTVNIFAEYPWGKQPLETITISQLPIEIEDKNTMVVSNALCLERAIMGLYCDAFNENESQNYSELKLNTRISPYKCTFAVRYKDEGASKELSELAFYLCKKFKKAGIVTLFLSDSILTSIESQFRRNDEWGIPYTLIVDNDTLKTGVIRLRNRDTTLEEEVHITDLVTYMLCLISGS